MRDLKDYSPAEWLRLIPLVHCFKQMRNDSMQYAYTNVRPPSLGHFLQNYKHLKGCNIGLVVAYEQPWVLDWLLRMAARHLADATLLVFDNSRRQKTRIEIEHICEYRHVPYLALPSNPTRHVNRSHGSAMTWIFRNVVRALEPSIFGFIDHDLIPIEKVEIGKTIGAQPFYGVINVSKWGWQLWAGYCLFDFSVVHNHPLNFLYDFYRDLDTGGRNFSCLYKNFDRSTLQFAHLERMEVRDALHNISVPVEIVDQRWLHLGGAGYSNGFKDKLDFYERIAKAADEGEMLPIEVHSNDTTKGGISDSST